MKNRIEVLIITLLAFLVLGSSFAAQPGKIPAFPGAEGFGRFASGGRGGDVYHVTNLNDDGVGSLRYGIERANGPRTIVFDVSGNIFLSDRIRIEKPDITIAGQTAPGDGITLAGNPLYVYSSNIIVRYIRCRLGDTDSDDQDAVSIVHGSNIIFDHVTASWSIDETFSCQSNDVDSLTVQWCMITESLRYSHHEKGAHGYGGIIGATRQTFHHNLYAHHSSRSPKITGRRHCEVDFRNNVIYNWGFNSCYDGTASYINWVNNYYKAGPGTESSKRKRIFQLSDEDIASEGSNSPEDSKNYETSLYAEGNYVVGYSAVTADNWNGGIDFMNGATEEKNRVYVPFDFPAITEQTAEDAYPLVLSGAGASLVRDTIDKRIVKEVFTGTVTYGNLGIIDSQTDVGGWPSLNSSTTLKDTDQDGMPDDWEEKNGLNLNDPNDRNDDLNGNGYTNLEEYLNGIQAIPTSVNNYIFEKSDALRCYPNPTRSNLFVDLRGIGKSDIAIYNIFGKLVYRAKANEGIYHIGEHGLSSGTYIVKIIDSNKKHYTQRIIVE
ncbi:T9SS type A sorting domain-containing protein [Sunxiuqinia indica]|uniref:T9SS type A sorting domain-containing protein n=1 Tax=Sunxiuqinia indica TaxID=2692584 RepID=UPI00135C766D|nr:T9SS type A sorting domain-containing protein [Sunxiuqinia indica]